MARYAKSARVSHDEKDNRKGAKPRGAATNWHDKHQGRASITQQSKQAQSSEAIIRKCKQRDETAELLHQVKAGVDDKFENKSSLDEEVTKIFLFHNREFQKANFPNPKNVWFKL